jgi:DHA1 family tetracycline resistance protein-like MFS transporter
MIFSGRFRAVVLVTLLVQSMGLGLIVPVMPRLTERFASAPSTGSSVLYGWSIAIFSAGAFVCSPLMGRLSDRFGRRPIVLLSLLGAILDYAVAALTTSAWVFLAARAVAGALTAGGVAVQAAVADVTPPAERARSFGVLGAAFGGGFIVGPAIGGLAGQTDPTLPFWVAAALCAFDLVLALLLFKETLPAASRHPLAWRTFNPVPSRAALRHCRVGGLIGVFALLNMGSGLADPVVILFMQHRLAWSTADVGLFMAVGGAGLIASRLALVPYAVARVGERRTILCGLLSLLAWSVLFTLIDTSWQMVAVGTLLFPASVTLPTLAALLSRRVPAADQGELQGVLGSIQSASAALGPPIGAALFDYFTATSTLPVLRAAPFLLCAAFVAAAFVVFGSARDVRTDRGSVSPNPG